MILRLQIKNFLKLLYVKQKYTSSYMAKRFGLSLLEYQREVSENLVNRPDILKKIEALTPFEYITFGPEKGYVIMDSDNNYDVLIAYIYENYTRVSDFCEEVGLKQDKFNYMNSPTTYTDRVKKKIEKATKGLITVESWKNKTYK